MSYILEALKKADQERDVGAVPNLATSPQVRPPQTRSHRWLWVVVALLLVNFVLVAALLLKDSGTEAIVTAQEAAEQSPALDNSPPTQPVQRTSEASLSPPPAPKYSTVTRIEPVRSGGGLVMLPDPAVPENSEPPSPANDKPVTGVGAATTATPTATDISQLQSWYELPLNFRNSLDLPRLDLHVYSQEPRDRFILVDFKKYREGERLESGIVLEEIFPEGMVMSYRGERFLVEK